MSQKRADTDDYLALFLNDTPLMDVRAPVEYEKGAFPGACNLPILNDQQREIIGTRYKQEGPDAAVSLGYQLATDEVRQERLHHWKQFVSQYPEGYLYCFRGGQRSHITQQWLADEGHPFPLVKGGYKALRRFLIDELERSVEESSPAGIGDQGKGTVWISQEPARSSIDQHEITIGSLVEQSPAVRSRFSPDRANLKHHAGTRKRIHK